MHCMFILNIVTVLQQMQKMKKFNVNAILDITFKKEIS